MHLHINRQRGCLSDVQAGPKWGGAEVGSPRAASPLPAGSNPRPLSPGLTCPSEFGDDEWDMEPQLSKAWPVHTYPHLVVTPDGNVAMSAGNLLVSWRLLYGCCHACSGSCRAAAALVPPTFPPAASLCSNTSALPPSLDSSRLIRACVPQWSWTRTGPTKFDKAFEYPPRPHTPWSYPNTGTGLPLPMAEPWDKMLFIAAGGSTDNKATGDTPASNEAHIIEVGVQ